MSFDAFLRQTTALQYGLIGRRQIRAAGFHRSMVAHRMERGILRPLTPEVLDLVGSPHSIGKVAMAAVLDSPDGAVLSHTAAAAWWGLPGFSLESGIHVTVPRRGAPRRGRLAQIHYQFDLPIDELTMLAGIPVTSPALTIFHLAAILGLKRTTRACDNGWSMRLFDGLDLHLLLKRLAASGRNGIGPMREILRQRPPGYVPPQSGLEARYYDLIVEDGMPEPTRQVNIYGRRWIGRCDCRFPDLPLIVELLSVRYHASLSDQERDEIRFGEFAATGEHVIAFWDFEVWEKPRFVVEETRRARNALLRGELPTLPSPFSRIDRGL